MAFPPMMGMMPSYHVHNFEVFFGNQHVPEAEGIHFNDLGQGYGKDMHHVFYMGQKIDQADGFSFEVIGQGYAKDHHHVYQYGRIMDGLNPMTFSSPPPMQPMPIHPGFAPPPVFYPMSIPSYQVKDFHVFFGNQYLSEAKWVHFKDLGQGYGKDMDHAFYMGQKMDGVHAMTFEVLSGGYAKDKDHVYHYGRIVEGLKPFGFHGP